MAKRTEINKSQAIRNALKEHRRATPTQIAEILRGQGVDVTATYVSNVKFHSQHRRKARKFTVGGTARRTRRPKAPGASSFAGIPAALQFVKSAGGLARAKTALATLEEISNAVR
jgi:hypothetical protein